MNDVCLPSQIDLSRQGRVLFALIYSRLCVCVLCAVLCVVSVCVLFIAYDLSYAVLVFVLLIGKERARPKAESFVQ